MIHELKIDIAYFKYVLAGEKTFEIRKNDRKYRVEDTIILNEWNEKTHSYTGRKVSGKIKYITDFMQLHDYVVFSFDLDSNQQYPFSNPFSKGKQMNAEKTKRAHSPASKSEQKKNIQEDYNMNKEIWVVSSSNTMYKSDKITNAMFAVFDSKESAYSEFHERIDEFKSKIGKPIIEKFENQETAYFELEKYQFLQITIEKITFCQYTEIDWGGIAIEKE